MELPKFLRAFGEDVAATDLGSMQEGLVELVEHEALSPAQRQELKTREERLLAQLGEKEREMFLDLDRLVAAERRQVLRAVFWRAFRLGLQVGAWLSSDG